MLSICLHQASGTPKETLSGRWCGNVRALLEDHGVHLPKKTPVTTAGPASKKNRRTSGLHHPTFSGTIILHPWITETCAQQIGIFMHSPTLPSRSMEVSPFYHHLLRCFSHEKIHPITREISLHLHSHLVTSSDKRCSCCCR